MAKIIMRIGKGGSMRAIHTDGFDFQSLGFDPAQRASHVEPIQSGPLAGWWAVDMSPLGEKYHFCFWPPHPPTNRAAALKQEHDWLVENWVKGKL